MYEAGDIRIGKPHLCRPSAKYPDNTAAAVANGGAVAKGGLALDGRPTLTPQEPKRPSLLVSTHTYLYLPVPLGSTTLPLLRMLSNPGYHTGIIQHFGYACVRVCVWSCRM